MPRRRRVPITRPYVLMNLSHAIVTWREGLRSFEPGHAQTPVAKRAPGAKVQRDERGQAETEQHNGNGEVLIAEKGPTGAFGGARTFHEHDEAGFVDGRERRGPEAGPLG